MTSYWVTNVGLGILVLLALLLLRSAPSRLKMWLCITAAVVWCIPWPMLASLWQSSDVFVHYVSFETLQSLPDAAVAITPVAPALGVPWLWVFAGLTVGGLCRFALRVLSYRRQHLDVVRTVTNSTDIWRRAGYTESSVPVYVLDDLKNAFVSGYSNPHICLGQKQLESRSLNNILLHELTHIRQRDNLVLLLITFLADVFWWNPIVGILTLKARHYVELSCDEACKKSSPDYRDMLASELFNREYRKLESRLTNPISWSRGFNVYRIRQLAKETSMKLRHLFLLACLMITSVVLATNIAASEEGKPARKIVTELLVSTVMPNPDGGIDTKSIKTVVVAEDEIKKMLELAKSAEVTVRTHMESEYRRIVTIDSVDMIETRKVLAAFENTGLHALYSNSTIQGTGRHIYLGVDFRTPGQPPYSVQLAPNVGEWTGVTVGEFLLRIRPDLEGVPGEQTVLLFTEISAQGEGENQWNLIGTPSVQTAFDREATIQIGHQIDDGEPTISLTMVPRTSLN